MPVRAAERGFVRSVGVVVSGTAAGQVIVLLASPILTRLYAPEEFGVLAVYAAILGAIAMVGSLSYELAIPLPRADRQAANILAVSLGTAVLVTATSALIIFALRERIGVWTGTPALRPYLWLIPVGVLFAAGYQVWNYWAIRTRSFSLIASTRLRQGLGSAGVQLGFGAAGAGPVGLILGQIVGQAAGAGSLVRGARSVSPDLLRHVSWRRMRWAARRYRRFPAIYSWAGLANALGLRSPAVLLAVLHGPAAAGTLLLAERVVGMPMKLVGSAVGQVYFAKMADLARKDRSAGRRLFRRLTARLVLLGGLGAAVVAIGGPRLFQLTLGGEWGTVGTYVRVLAAMYVVQFAVGPVSQTLAVLEMQGVKLAWEIVRLAAVGGAFALAWIWRLDPARTLAVYATLSGASLLLLLYVTDRSFQRIPG